MCGAGFSNFHESNIHVINNVFASTGYPFGYHGAGNINDLVQHNYFVEQVCMGTQNGNAPSGNVFKDNVWQTSPGFYDNCEQGGGCGCTATYNLNPGASHFGTGSVNGSPIFVSSPASGYYHYVLASNSPGYHAGSDGLSMGITAGLAP